MVKSHVFTFRTIQSVIWMNDQCDNHPFAFGEVISRTQYKRVFRFCVFYVDYIWLRRERIFVFLLDPFCCMLFFNVATLTDIGF